MNTYPIIIIRSSMCLIRSKNLGRVLFLLSSNNSQVIFLFTIHLFYLAGLFMLFDYEFQLSLVPNTHQLEVCLMIKDGYYLDGDNCSVN